MAKRRCFQIKLGPRQTRLLQEIATYPDFGQGLHTAQVRRIAQSLIQKGVLDDKWLITAAGRRLLESSES